MPISCAKGAHEARLRLAVYPVILSREDGEGPPAEK